MQVLDREFFTLAVIAAPLSRLVELFSVDAPSSVVLVPTPLVFPAQRFTAREDDPPMVMWSPSATPELTAFMPRTESGDLFVIAYANKNFGLPIATGRSTTASVQWPIAEFITYSGHKQRRFVRAMRDSPRWQFFADGNALPFEDATRYTRRFIKDRFVREDVIRYLEGWGAPVRDPEFWRGSQAMTFARRTPNPSFQRTASRPLN